jgi:aminotransferase EvaB
LTTIPEGQTELHFQDLRVTDKEFRKYLHELIDSLCDSGIYINGVYTSSFADLLSEYTGIESFTPVGNGTNALEIILRYLKILGFKSVGCQANAGGYSTGAALLNGLSVILVDVNPSTGLVDLAHLEEAYHREKFDIFVYTHLYGNGQNLLDIQNFCEREDIVLVEDCAQAFGLKIDNKHVGSFGRFSAFSFYPTKNLGTLGDAGAIACSLNDTSSIKSMTQYGWKTRYSIEIQNGTNSRIDEFHAGILSKLLFQVDSNSRSRVHKLGLYQENMPKEIGSFVTTSNSVAHLAVLKCTNRQEVKKVLDKENIPYSVHYPIPDHKQVAWKHLFTNLNLPNSEKLSESILSLPLGRHYSPKVIFEICRLLSQVRS